MKRFITVLTILTVAVAGLVATAPKADASAYWVWNNDTSAGAINVYNKAGCYGAHNQIEPGGNSSTDHLWKTVWVPAHSRMRFLSASYGYSYHIDNTHGWRTCHNIGRYFELISWHISWHHI
jgi:hypothetical protein